MAGLFLCIFLILAAVLFTKKKSTDIFTMAEASKILAYAATDFKTSGTDDTGKYWYSGYVNAVSEAGLLKIKKPEAKVRVKDTYALAKKLEVPETVLAELQNSAKAMTKQEFLDVFMQLLPYMQNGEQVVKMQARPQRLNRRGSGKPTPPKAPTVLRELYWTIRLIRQ